MSIQLTLPSSAPRFRPAEHSWKPEVHANSLPARTFTGDFYFSHWDDGQLWFAAGDVSGKGLRAALVMAMIQEQLEHQLQSSASARSDPATTLTRLHTFLRPLLGGNRFATAVAGTLTDDGRLRIANAGHCPPLILRKDGAVEEVPSTGPVAGLLERATWRTVDRELQAGDLLAIYSDGFSEAESPVGEEFGSDRLVNVLRQCSTSSLERLSGIAFEAVRRHTSGTFSDDRTLLLMRMPESGIS